jgi:NAD(P)-dependent dehydrogenase (short-subunit alcohol dehydrogenase family)
MKENNYNGQLQAPIDSGFNAASTAADVIREVDLANQIVIVTGGYAGIGLEAVKAFVSAGATVIVPARDLVKAEKNLKGIPNVELEHMDLMDPVSITFFAEKFIASGRPLHLLINNAGIMWVPLKRDSRGYESQLSTNHLGHFQLTALLWPSLLKADGARVVNVSSWGHHYSAFNFEDPNFQHRKFESLLGYGQSKTANILFSMELDHRGLRHKVRSYSLHPGAIADSDLKRYLSNEELQQLGVYDANNNVIHDVSKGLKTLAQGASTTVWCATSKKLDDIGGVYCENTEIARMDSSADENHEQFSERMNDIEHLTGVTPYALNAEQAVRLWSLSEELTGVTFEI